MAERNAKRPQVSADHLYVAGLGAIQAAMHIYDHPGFGGREQLLFLPVCNLVAFAMEALFKAYIVHSGTLTSDEVAVSPFGHRLETSC